MMKVLESLTALWLPKQFMLNIRRMPTITHEYAIEV